MTTLPRKPVLLGLSLLVGALAMLLNAPAFPFLLEFTSGGAQVLKWATPFPLVWREGANATVNSSKLVGGIGGATAAMTASFNTWQSAPNTNVSFAQNLTPSPVTDVATQPHTDNLVCFTCTGADFSSSDGTLAITITTTTGGHITQADLLFNPSPSGICFTTGPSQSCPNSGDSPQDLQTVATHEIGHFLGLDHSAVVRAVMFPFAPSVLTTLSYDDVAAVSTLYPKSTQDVQTGTISGTVSMAGGGGIFGAHVSANSVTSNSPFSGFPSIRKTPIGTLTLPGGNYQVQGVPADSYTIIAEPLDLPVSNTDVSEFSASFGQGAVQTNFTTRWH